MANTPFKLKGMTFKGDTPFKFVNMAKAAKKFKDSKVGQTKGGKKISKALDKVAGAQEKFIAKKKELGLSTPEYDANVAGDTPSTSTPSETTTNVSAPTTPTSSALINAPGSPDAPRVPTVKRSPAKIYGKGGKRRKNYKY